MSDIKKPVKKIIKKKTTKKTNYDNDKKKKITKKVVKKLTKKQKSNDNDKSSPKSKKIVKTKTSSNTIDFRLLDFIVKNIQIEESDDDSSSDSEYKYKPNKDNNHFAIQVFGLDEKGDTYSIDVNDFEPFFYMKVADSWSISTKTSFLNHIKSKVDKNNYYENSITDCKLIKRHELYGFDDGKEFNFIMMKFKNMTIFNKVKNLFYHDVVEDCERKWKLKSNGYKYQNTNIFLYESNIPPLLRYFHIKNISPSGWVSIPKKNLIRKSYKTTTCKYEFETSYKSFIPLNNKETIVPYKICSFDIEASSSHGDFPVPIKSYKKLATNLIEYWEHENENIQEMENQEQKELLKQLIFCAFEYGENNYIDIVYPKKPPKNQNELEKKLEKLISHPIIDLNKIHNLNKDIGNNSDSKGQLNISDAIEKLWNNSNNEESLLDNNDIDENINNDFYKKQNRTNSNKINNSRKSKTKTQIDDKAKILDILNNLKIPRDERLNYITSALNMTLPKLEGDKVTFIGSTFMKYGEKEPYLNHCIALNTCDEISNSTIEQYNTEKQVLLAWTKLIQRENPDIIIGYNIFGFDYKFMYYRCLENGIDCLKQFLKLSRNRNEICGKEDKNTGIYKIEESSITIASGTHNLSFIKMNGRIQIDLYNYFRREYNLTSYKLDYVSGHFIGDSVKSIEVHENCNYTLIKSKNLTGLHDGNFIHFEEIGHSSEFYKNGAKFEIYDVDEKSGIFKVKSAVYPDMKKKVKWCLAKDDVSPQDIFRMTNEGAKERAIIAKYCIQDCNLVHHLLRKIDVITGLVEMAKICNVPIDFLIMRGQGIKLFSFIAKKCREAKTLIPVLEKKNDGGYEGAIVLKPKSGLYLDEPVACVDYSSLYPSSMISENISHDSKVWTREYDLDGKLIKETGVKDKNGDFLYDNLPKYKYVDVEYDTYEYRRKTPKSAAVKTKVGKKLCRFAQFPDGELAIMPRILKELLAARKATRTSAKFKTVKTNIGNYSGLIIDKNEQHITLKDKDGNLKIIEMETVHSVEDTFDDFMKNVLDKRQLAIKMTANSLYGQCGAKTSSFYEKDVAASTTATGRKLLTYGKRIIEEVYGDRICETKYGKVHSHAEYIYGDSVTGNTPIILKNIQTGNIEIKTICELGGHSIEWKEYNELKPFDSYKSNRREKLQSTSYCNKYLIWCRNGWCKFNRVIRHKCNKKIYRIVTSNSVVDVTEDHSLLDKNGKNIKPNNCLIGTKLLHNPLFHYLKENNIQANINKRIYNENEKTEMAKTILHLMNSHKNFNIQYNKEVKLFEIINNTYVDNNTDIDNNEIKYIQLLYDTNKYNDYVYDIETEDGTFNTGFPLIIKNTDSVFMSFKLTDPESGEKIVGKPALKHTIELAKEAGELASMFLKPPHDLEYEKTFMPFCLLSKKRYVGMLYEEDPDSCYRKSMGIVLKRRDNAPIVKDIYGGNIDILMKEKNVQSAVNFTRKFLNDIVNEKYPLDKLIITKSLNAFYKNPQQIAHKVLADRMAKRDPGNKPNSGDRIPFVYIQTKGKKVLQGEKVEHPDFIRENKIKPDYAFYITNQIMKPLIQVFSLVLEDIPEKKTAVKQIIRKQRMLERKYKDDEEKQAKYVQKFRDDQVKKLIFDDALRKCKLAKNNQQSIIGFFH